MRAFVPLRRTQQISARCAFFGMLFCATAIAHQPPNTIDLAQYGYPPASKAWNPDACPVPYRGYHWIEWLDDEHLVVIFNTVLYAPRSQGGVYLWDRQGRRNYQRGKLEAERDIPYVADLWETKTPGSGLAIGPGIRFL